MDIGEAVNIGPKLAMELRAAGITTLEELKALGYLEGWRRLGEVAPQRCCTNSCLALAGAIEGIRWMSLPAEVRARIGAEAKAMRGS